ncbi:MAG: hypothetical protein V4644_03140 [Patescibacteria group bacterium]
MLVRRLRKKPAVSILDLDNTCTGSEAEQLQMHEAANAAGAVVYNTARETGMVMSSKALEASRKYGYRRAAPNLATDEVTGRYRYEKPERLRQFAGHLDPDAIVGFGGGIRLRQPDRGYPADETFSALLGGPDFRKDMRHHFESMDIDGDLLGALSELEDGRAFAEGRTNVESLDWRFQFNPRDEQHMTDLKFRIASRLLEVGARKMIDFRDESKPGYPCFYVVPLLGTKEASADYLLRKAAAEAGLQPEDLRLTIADDAFTGLYQLRDLLPEAPATYILPGGAPVAKHLIPGSSEYGKPFSGNDVGWLLEPITPLPLPGHYVFRMRGDQPDRTFIIADEANERISVGSLLALQEQGHLYTF